MKRRTFISLMSVMAAAGVLTLSGCSNSSGSTAASGTAASVAPAAGDQLSNIQSSGKLIVALEGAWQPWSFHDESDTFSNESTNSLVRQPGKIGYALYDENVLSTMEATGLDCGGNELAGGAPKFYKGASVTPVYDPIELQINKLRQKVENGAEYIQTQGIFDLETFKRFLDKVWNLAETVTGSADGAILRMKPEELLNLLEGTE